MPVADESPAEFEGQIFAIPEHLIGRRGQITEWSMRIIGVIAFLTGVAMILRSTIPATTAAVLFMIALLAIGSSLFYLSWNTRCRRFGWRLRYMGTWQYIDRGEARHRLAHPAPGTPADIEDAETSFMLRRVRRLDGTRTW